MSRRSYRKIRHRSDVLTRPIFKTLVANGRALAKLSAKDQAARRAELKPSAADLRGAT